MGTSSDAILTYGVDLSLGDNGYAVEVPWDTKDTLGLKNWWSKINGLDDSPWDVYGDWSEAERERGNSGGLLEYETLHPEWVATVKKLATDNIAIQEKLPVEIVEHCHYNDAMYVLAVKGHTLTANRGIPEIVRDLNVNPEAESAARAFCKTYAIEWNPKWWLVSYWG